MARRTPAAAARGGRRDEVLRAAEALFAQRGYRGVGLREIAAQVGMRAPSLFKHFTSKKALYDAVLLNIFHRLDTVAGRLEGNQSFAARLEAYLRGYVDLVSRDPSVVPLLFREMMERRDAMQPATRARAFTIYRRVDAFLEAGQQAGVFRRADRASLHITLSGAILYHALAARSYRAALGNHGKAPSREAWKRTVLATAQAMLLKQPKLAR